MTLKARQLLVWCYAYYELNESLVSDAISDATCQELLNTFDDWHPQFMHKDYLTRDDLIAGGYHGQKGWPLIVKHAAKQALYQPIKKRNITVTTTEQTKPVYSVSQLSTLSKCSMMYKLQYVDKAPQTRPSDAMMLGSATGAAVQALVVEYKGANITKEVARTAFAHAFVEVFSKEVPLELVNHCLELLEGKTSFEVVADGGNIETLDTKTFMAWLDMQFINQQHLGFQYGAMSKSAKKYRFLEAIKFYPNCVYNAYMTMAQNGLLSGVSEVVPEYEARIIGGKFDIIGYLDLLLKYDNGNTAIVELKTSRPDEKMPGASSCEQDKNFVSKALQANFYYYFGKKNWGSKFAGLYWLNSSYQNHFVKYEENADQQALLPIRFKALHAIREQGLFLPVCGTGSNNLMIKNKMCSVSCSCPFV